MEVANSTYFNKKHMEAANSTFVFKTVPKEKIEKLVTNLNIKKSVQSNDILIKKVKEFDYLFSKYIAISISRIYNRRYFYKRL